jgi:hypothetical protein
MDYASFIEMLVVAGIKHSTWQLSGEEGIEKDGFSVYIPPQAEDAAPEYGVEVVFLEDGSLHDVYASED